MTERRQQLDLLQRRDFLRFAGWAGVSLFLPWTIIQGDRPPLLVNKRSTETPDFREKRHLNRKALIVGGGSDAANNYLSFFLDTLLWYYLCRDTLLIPAPDITVLYFDGRLPQASQILKTASSNSIRTYLEYLLSIYPVSNLPITAAASKPQFLEKLSRLTAVTELAQLLVFRSGHGTLHWEETSSGLRTTHSAMTLFGDELLTSKEYGHAVQENQANTVISFFNQCDALLFHQLPKAVNNLVVLTSNGDGSLVEKAFQDTRANISWPWSMAARDGLLYPLLADYDQNGQISLLELQRYILTHDYMATNGFAAEWSLDSVKTHPDLSYGTAVNPNNVILLQDQEGLPA